MGYKVCHCGNKMAGHARQCMDCRKSAYPDPNIGITPEQIAWVAGVLEGEGCWSRQKSGWYITVSMTDWDVIQRLQQYTGVGTIGKKSGRPQHKQAYYWMVHAHKHRIWLTGVVKPWLGVRRLTKLELLGI